MILLLLFGPHFDMLKDVPFEKEQGLVKLPTFGAPMGLIQRYNTQIDAVLRLLVSYHVKTYS